jgi:ABC-type nitrate/sulfonate/bicarbonate transport system substrate-binding protein
MSVSKRSRWLAGVVVVVAGAVAVSIALTHQSKKPSVSDTGPFVIKTWTRKDCSVTPWVVAEKKGFLAEEGITLELTGETQPALQIPSILRGDNDVASFHPNTIAVAKAGGAQITGVAEADIDPPNASIDPKYRHMWWYINPDKHPEIHSFADLAKLPGKIKISTITNNICADFETNLLADHNGIPRDRIEWISMPDIQAIQALKQGLVDASEVHPPFYKGMADAGARKIADSFDTGLGPSAGIGFYVFRDDFIKNHPRQVAAFARAIIKAQTWSVNHPAEATKLTEEAIGVPVTGNHYYSTSLKVDESLAAPWLADLVATNVIPAGKVTTSTLVTHEIEKLNNPQL